MAKTYSMRPWIKAADDHLRRLKTLSWRWYASPLHVEIAVAIFLFLAKDQPDRYLLWQNSRIV